VICLWVPLSLSSFGTRRENCIDLLNVEFVQDELVMDLSLMRGSLGQRLRRSPVDCTLAISYSVQILQGLRFLHDIGIIHRDLKPDNILLSEGDCVKICDCGLSHCVSGAGARAPLVCTLYYRPPELLMADAFETHAESTWYGSEVDVWSAGCIIRELLIGRGGGGVSTGQVGLLIQKQVGSYAFCHA
ncbi:unnamed protein product, partial [Colletotrichum noveboracense]